MEIERDSQRGDKDRDLVAKEMVATFSLCIFAISHFRWFCEIMGAKYKANGTREFLRMAKYKSRTSTPKE